MNNTLFEIKERVWRRWMDMRHWRLYGDPHFPKLITIEISTECNRACPYCVNSVAPSPKLRMDELTFATVLKRLREIDYRGKVVFSHFSEPTLDERLPRFVRWAKREMPKCHPVIYTNGDHLTRKLVGELVDAGASYISVTRHLPTGEAWELNVRALMRRFPKHIQFRETLAGRQWLFNFGGSVPNPPAARQWNACPSITWNMVIYHNADVPLCTCAPYRQPVMGNLKSEKLLDVWRKPVFVALRKQARSGQPTYALCQKCYNRK